MATVTGFSLLGPTLPVSYPAIPTTPSPAPAVTTPGLTVNSPPSVNPTSLTDYASSQNTSNQQYLAILWQAMQMQAAAAAQGQNIQLETFIRALQANQQGQDQSLAALQQAGQQKSASDIWATKANLALQILNAQNQQAQNLPFRNAQLSMLQALPALQSLMGLPTASIPNSMPQVDYSQYQNILNGIDQFNNPAPVNTGTSTPGAAGVVYPTPGATGSFSNPITIPGMPIKPYQPTGPLNNMLPIQPTSSIQPASYVPSTSTDPNTWRPELFQAGMPTTADVGGWGAAMMNTPANQPMASVPGGSITSTPLFNYQMKENEAAIRRMMAARGLLNSSHTLSATRKMAEGLTANETDKQVGRLQNLINTALGMPSSTPTVQTNFMPISGNADSLSSISSIYNQGARDRANMTSNFGQNYGSGIAGSGSDAAQNFASFGNILNQMKNNNSLNAFGLSSFYK